MTTILLVEDNETNRDMLTRRLRKKGFEVVCAVNGQEGCDMARELTPDVILMDMEMPVMDGYEATRRLKADAVTAGIPLIGLSAHAMAEHQRQAMAAGCDDYETKPIEFPRLLDKIMSRTGKPAAD